MLYARASARITSNTVTEVMAGRGHISRIIYSNNDGAARFLQIFNLRSTSVTFGTTVPAMSIQLAANTSGVLNFGDAEFLTAFSYGVSTTELGGTGPTSVWITVTFV